ncbi:carboxylesterase 1C-like [Pollicipes pollicipes]|uniref:carboxylesterase 1C-like n=1 Tax=Pollicipes pollicipes TaxID=41117 RepID=UPI0018851040|nr:carboxylesterase 1C-like [Pollicipes pollicipes]
MLMYPVKNQPYGALNATFPPPACAQSGIQGPGSEDCLYLSVFTTQAPNATHNPMMPVMVFIYGGAFTSGGSSLYYPNRLQKNKDVVLVVPHYRLGVIGFFTTLTDDAPGNAGLMDQPRTRSDWAAGLPPGLFHQAIAESGSALADWAYNDNPLLTSEQMADRINCTFRPFDQLLQCMRNVPAKDLVQLTDDFTSAERLVARNGFDGVNPVVQPSTLTVPILLPKDPLAIFEEGTYNKVPTMQGCNKNEGSFVFGLMYNEYLKVNNLTDDTDFLKNDCVRKMLTAFHVLDPTDGVTKSMIDQYFYYVDNWDINTMYPGLEDLTGLFGMKAGAKKQADMLARDGVDSWLYSFEYRGQKQHTMARLFFIGNKKLPFDTGVTHANELIYLFPIPLMSTLNAEETQVSDTMVEMWTNFAFEGNPTPPGSGLTHWPPVSEHGSYLQITSTPTVKHDYSQTFIISVQDYINSTVTTTSPPTTTPSASTTPSATTTPSASTTPSATTTPPAPTTTGEPTTSTESNCQERLDSLADERDTFRGATIGLAAVAGVAALLALLIAAVFVSRSRARLGARTGSRENVVT